MPFSYHSPEWRAIRILALRRDGYRCVICRCSVAGKGQARVDHIHAVKTHPHLALTLSNLRTLCPAHDAQAHREKGGTGGPRNARFVIRECDASGMPSDPNHPWRKEAGGQKVNKSAAI